MENYGHSQDIQMSIEDGDENMKTYEYIVQEKQKNTGSISKQDF